MPSLFTILNTLSHTRSDQIANRITRTFRYRYLYPRVARALFPMTAVLSDFPSSSRNMIFNEDQVSYILLHKRLLQEAEGIQNHRFSFLNLPAADLGALVDWQPAGYDPLWLYTLHYGEWAQTLSQAYRTTGEVRYRDALIGLMAEWIDHNPVCKGPGWEPYPLSRRIVAWTKVALSLIEDDEWKSFWKERLAPSLHQQTRVLAANLEKDLANNHLIANYRAIAWMGLLFPDWSPTSMWRTIGLDGLWSEMRRQVLPDGAHDERSISYHTIVLQDFLETWYISKMANQEMPGDVEPILRKMLQFLADMVAPDGSYPMLNDTVPGYPVDPGDVLYAGGMLFGRQGWLGLCAGVDTSYASFFGGMLNPDTEETSIQHEKTSAVYPDAGYVVLRDGRTDCLYFDAGPMGPRHLPGHGHADALGIVLYGKKKPLIVDPGVYSYHDKKWRDHFRSTSAHNTVTVDGQDQCVFWGNFRVAYPPTVRLLEHSEKHVVGEHEGYSRLRHPVIHRRIIQRKGSGEWGISDHFRGSGEHDFVLSLQFSPGAEVKRGDSQVFVTWPDRVKLEITHTSPMPGAKILIEDGWVSPGWNLKAHAPRYTLSWRSRVPVENRITLKVTD